jgi:hypothetical protein
MATKEIERKIAVIFATDVVGYSKSIEKNEDQTAKKYLRIFFKNMTAEFLIRQEILYLPNFLVLYLLLSVQQNSRDS